MSGREFSRPRAAPAQVPLPSRGKYSAESSKFASKLLVREAAVGLGLGLVAAAGWKVYHWKVQRDTKEYYDWFDKQQPDLAPETRAKAKAVGGGRGGRCGRGGAALTRSLSRVRACAAAQLEKAKTAQ